MKPGGSKSVAETLFHEGVNDAQRRFADVHRAHRIAEGMGDVAVLDMDQAAFLESVPFFFLATADGKGNVQCNFKGGGPGIIEVIDNKTICYPEYSGNDLMLSVGNILVHPFVGLLALSFDLPRRLKLSGQAELIPPSAYRGRQITDGVRIFVRINLNQVVRNCSRRIPHLGIVNKD